MNGAQSRHRVASEDFEPPTPISGQFFLDLFSWISFLKVSSNYNMNCRLSTNLMLEKHIRISLIIAIMSGYNGKVFSPTCTFLLWLYDRLNSYEKASIRVEKKDEQQKHRLKKYMKKGFRQEQLIEQPNSRRTLLMDKLFWYEAYSMWYTRECLRFF